MSSVFSFLYTLVLLSRLSSHMVAVAQPASKLEDGPADGDVMGLIASIAKSAAYRGSQVLDVSMRDEDRRPQIAFISVSLTF